MANKTYYKLGEQAEVFYDASLRILIRKGEVLEFDKAPKSKKFNMAKAGGHISMASKAEYDDYMASKGIIPVTLDVTEAATETEEKKEEPTVVASAEPTPARTADASAAKPLPVCK